MTIEEQLEKAERERDAWKRVLDATNEHIRNLAEVTEPGYNRHPHTVVQSATEAFAKLYKERDEARASVADAYRRGAEAMREACAQWIPHLLCTVDCDREESMRALPIPEEPAPQVRIVTTMPSYSFTVRLLEDKP